MTAWLTAHYDGWAAAGARDEAPPRPGVHPAQRRLGPVVQLLGQPARHLFDAAARHHLQVKLIEMLLDVTYQVEGHTICALGDAAAWPVQSFLNHYFDEFQYMIRNNGRSIVNATADVAA